MGQGRLDSAGQLGDLGPESREPAAAWTDASVAPRPLRVLVVHDRHLFRAGLRQLLSECGFRVVGEVPAGEAVRALVDKRDPDVAVLDLHAPDASGVEVIRHLVSKSPPVEVLVLSASAARGDVVGAIEAGAAGYLLKDAEPEEIARGIRAAAEGHAMLSPEAAVHVVRRARRGHEHWALESLRAAVSKRELDVLRLLAEGLENKEIATELVVSRATVKHHVSAILFKLEVSNRVQAAVTAVKSGLV